MGRRGRLGSWGIALAAVAGLVLPAQTALAGTGATIAQIAQANVGKHACSVNSNGGTAFDSSCTGNGGQPEYWCADFARWVWAAAGVNTSALDAAAGSFYVYGQRNNTLHYPPSVGDAVVFDYSGGGVADHVAIVVVVNADNSVETVSGDWGGESGSEAEFSSTSSAVLNVPAYASTVGSHPAEMGMTISGFISPIGGPPPCADQCVDAARVGLVAASTGGGYWIADSQGHVYPNGNASFFGDLTGVSLSQPVVGIAATPSGQGYWMVAADGGVFSFGNAGFHGSKGGSPINKPVVGMASTASGEGYWLVAADGGIFSFGDAVFEGSTGSMTLNAPVVGMSVTPTGAGYWLVASDGGIFAFGDASFEGSAGSMMLNKPVVGMTSTSTGKGYWLVAADGGIFSYGDAAFYGSAGGTMLNAPIVGIGPTADRDGYWLLGQDGGIFTYGDAPYLGNALGSTCAGDVPVACVVALDGCTVPSNQAACGSGDTCAHGTCQASCADACAAGTSQCSGAQIELCGHYGTAPCNTWSPATDCPPGASCAAGVCAFPTCSDACESGATECVGGMLVTCTATTSDGCRTWSTPTACQFGQTCAAGGCVSTTDAGALADASATGDGSTKTSTSTANGSGSGSGHTSSTGSSRSTSGSGGGDSSGNGSSAATAGGEPGSSSGCRAARGDASEVSLDFLLLGLATFGLRRRRTPAR